MHTPTLGKMPTMRQVWLLIQQEDYVFPIDLKDAYLHTSIVKNHHYFLYYAWWHRMYKCKVLPFGLDMAPRVFTLLTKPILLLCHYKDLLGITYLNDILVLTHSVCAGKRAQTFLCSLLVHLDYILVFPSQNSILHSSFPLWAYVGI